MKTVLRAARLRRCIRLVASAALSALLGLFPGASARSANAAGLECPEIDLTGVPDLTSDPTRAKLLLGGSGTGLGNEISELIAQLQLKEPDISNADLTNGLIAAYCPAGRTSAGADQRGAMEPDASVCSNASAATRRELSAAGVDDHCRSTGAACGLPPAQKPGGGRRSDAGAAHGVRPRHGRGEVGCRIRRGQRDGPSAGSGPTASAHCRARDYRSGCEITLSAACRKCIAGRGLAV